MKFYTPSEHLFRKRHLGRWRSVNSKTTLRENDTPRHHDKCDWAERSKIKEDPQWPIFESAEWFPGKNISSEMCALPFPTQFSISEEWADSLDVGFREIRQYSISETPGKIDELLKREGNDKDKEAGDLIFRKLNTARKESNRDALKEGSYEPATKKWLFALSNLHMGQS